MTEVIREENKVLKKELISSLIDLQIETKEKFLKSLERQEERVQSCIDEVVLILQEQIKKEFLIQAVVQFESLQLLLIVNRMNNNRHFTKNRIIVNFLAILDNLLASNYEKIRPQNFAILRKNIEGLSQGKAFSYNTMKKRQIELIQKGYITKIRKISYTLKLKDKFCKIINHMMNVYPQHQDKLIEMERVGYELVHAKAIPKLEVKKSAAVIIGNLARKYFQKKEEQSLIWKYLESLTDEEEKKLKRKVYRFNSNLKKENNFLSYTLD